MHKLLALAMMVGFAVPALASTTATITVGGSEQQISGSWDHGTITVAFNSFSETITYGQFSSAASVAAALAGMFSRDYAAEGLSAKAGCPPNGGVITFTLQGTATFGSLGVSNPASSFQLSSSGFQSTVTQTTPTLTWPLPDPITYGTALSSTQLNATANVPGTFSYDPPAGTVLPPGNQVLGVTFTPTDTTNYSVVTETIPLIVNASSSGGGQTVYSYGLNYAPNSNVNGYNDSVMGAWTFDYDSLNRLAQAQASQPGNSITSYCWSYDAFGNRWQQMGSDQAISGGGGSLCEQQPGANVNYTWANYSSNNRMTYTVQAPGGVQYDAAGNMTYDGTNHYLYNSDGQICAVQWTYNSITVMTGYIYDADGHRVAKGTISTWGSCDPSVNGFTPTAEYVRDQAGNQLSEFTPGQDGTMTWQHTNVYANGALIATEDTSEAHFYLNDWLGTRRVQTDYEGVVEQTCSSLPFGDDDTCAPTPTENLFTGKERDSESGLDNFGPRYYSSNLGRWLSPDPGGMKVVSLNDPQTWNMYVYSHENPVTFNDPTGLQTGLPCNSGGKPSAAHGECDDLNWVMWFRGKPCTIGGHCPEKFPNSRAAILLRRAYKYLKEHGYFKYEGGIGIGDKTKVGPATLDISARDTIQNTSAPGDSTKAEVKHVGISVEVKGRKVGFEAEQSTVTYKNGKEVYQSGPWKFVPGFERGDVSVKGSEIGVGDTLCVVVCGGFELGVETGGGNADTK